MVGWGGARGGRRGYGRKRGYQWPLRRERDGKGVVRVS